MTTPREQLRRNLLCLLGWVVNGLLNHDVVFRLVGLLNGGAIGTVFLAYPSRRPLQPGPCQVRFMERFRWPPAITGIFRQGRGWGLTFGVSASEPELIDAQNATRLQALAGRMEQIRRLVGAERCALAGVLPSILNGRGEDHGTTEAEVAAECVVRAIGEVRRREGLEGCPLIVLGARGLVGSRVMARLAESGVHAVDRLGEGATELPEVLRGQRAVLVNLTWSGVLETYISQMWPGLVVLNEVYPPPGLMALRAIGAQGVTVYHLAGVKGFAFPPFPGDYSGGLPCCAASGNGAMEIVVVKVGS